MIPIEKKSRPKLLSWLCIGSAVFGSFWIVMLVALIVYSLTGQVPKGVFPGIAVEYLQAGNLFMLSLILAAALGLTGVFMMWKMKRTGFYLYSAMKTIIYFLPVTFIGSSHLNYPGLVLTSVPIVVYGIIFKGASAG